MDSQNTVPIKLDRESRRAVLVRSLFHGMDSEGIKIRLEEIELEYQAKVFTICTAAVISSILMLALGIIIGGVMK